MKKTIRLLAHARGAIRFIVILAVAISSAYLKPHTSFASSTVHFVRVGSSGNGSSWNNALPTVTAALSKAAAGDSICIAAGSYEGFSVNKSGTKDARITIKRATASDPQCGSGTAGWNSSYDAVVNFTSRIVFQLYGAGSYVTIDGVVQDGIKVVAPDLNDGGAIWFLRGGQDSTELKHLDIAGPGGAEPYKYLYTSRGIDATAWNGAWEKISNLVISHCSFHGSPSFIYFANVQGALVEHNRFFDNPSSNGKSGHVIISIFSSNVIFRYNVVKNWAFQGIFLERGKQENWYLYGNIWHDGHPGTNPRIMDGMNEVSGPVYVINNTFYNIQHSFYHDKFGWAKGSVSKNNIFMNMMSPAMSGGVNWEEDYNLTDKVNTQAHGIGGATADIFTNVVGKDFSLVPMVGAKFSRDNGTKIDPIKLTTPIAGLDEIDFSKDFNGNTRGGDGAWDIGAIEFVAGPTNGSCGALINSCAQGNFVDSPDSSTHYLWSCAGSNQGTTASCGLPQTLSDTTAPTSPDGLGAADITKSSVTISWQAASDNIGVKGYRVYRNATQIASRETLSFNDTGLTDNTTYQYTVVAFDAAGNVSAPSAVLSVTTGMNTNYPPEVSLTTAAAGVSFVEPANIGIAAIASDIDGTIQKVEFYSGSSLLGTDTTSPYVLALSNIPAGSYSFTARAYDDKNAAAVSNPVTMTVTTPMVNVPATTQAISVETQQDVPVDIVLLASDPNQDFLTYSIVKAPTNGTLTGKEPALSYEPKIGFIGEDSFSYKVNDGLMDSNISTVNIKVLEQMSASVNKSAAETVEEAAGSLEGYYAHVKPSDVGQTIGVGVLGPVPTQKYSGSLTITAPVTIENAILSGCVTISAKNVVIRNSIINCHSNYPVRLLSGADNFVMEYSKVTCSTKGKVFKLEGAKNTLISRNEVQGCEDFFFISDGDNDGLTVVNNYMHSLTGDGLSHADGFQIGEPSVTTGSFYIRGNYFDPNNDAVSKTALIFVSTYASNVKITMEDNYFAQWGCILLRCSTSKGGTASCTIRNNIFDNSFKNPIACGSAKAFYLIMEDGSDGTFSCNRYQDGAFVEKTHADGKARITGGINYNVNQCPAYSTQGNGANTPKPVCSPSWECTEFSACTSDGIQTRTCTDIRGCGTLTGKPKLLQSCVIPDTQPETVPEPTTSAAIAEPVALYTFNEASGSVVNDVSGYKDPLNLKIATTNTVLWKDSAIDIARAGLIVSEQAPHKIYEAIRSTNEMSLAVWIKPHLTNQNGPARIVSNSVDPYLRNFTLSQEGSAYDFRLRSTAASTNGMPSIFTPNTVVNINGLSHVVVSRDKMGNRSIFIDGQLVKTDFIGGDLSNWDNQHPLMLGNELTNDRPWLGEIHQVAVYNRAMPKEEVLALFNKGHADAVVLEKIELEAESGVLASPMVVSKDSSSLNGMYISSTVKESGQAVFTFESASGGDYVIWARVLLGQPTPKAHDSFYVKVNGSTEELWDVYENILDQNLPTQWGWEKISARCGGTFDQHQCNPLMVQLQKGTNTLVFRGRDTDTRLDKIIVTNDFKFIPTQSAVDPKDTTPPVCDTPASTTCDEWSACENSMQSRVCRVSDPCGAGASEHTQEQSCVMPNTAPVAQGQTFEMDEDTALPIVLLADDADGDVLSFAIISEPQQGTISGTGKNLTYTPNPDYYGTDNLSFKVSDGQVDSETAVVTIVVRDVPEPNVAPVAQGASTSMNEDTTLSLTLLASDDNGDSLTYSIVDQPAHGTLSMNVNSVEYTPGENYFGTDSFSFKVNDGLVDSNVAVVNIEIADVPEPNVPPVVQDIIVETDQGTPKTIELLGSDADNDQLTFTIVAAPENGTVVVNNQEATFTPNPEYVGTDTCKFKASDGKDESNEATITLSIVKPTLENITLEAESGQITSPMVVVNDSLASGGKYIKTPTKDSGKALFTFNAANAGEYIIWAKVLLGQPTPRAHDSFYLRVNSSTEEHLWDVYEDVPDASLRQTWGWEKISARCGGTYDVHECKPLVVKLIKGENTLEFRGRDTNTYLDTLVVTNDFEYIPPASVIRANNTAPVANGQTVETNEDTSVSITLSATDIDSDPLTYSIVSQPGKGFLSGSGKTRTYHPNPNNFGDDKFTFNVWDGERKSADATVTVRVKAVNDAPVISAIANQTIKAGSNTGSIGFTISDPETGSSFLTVSAGSSNANLVPLKNIVLGGTGGTRTITITPVATLAGEATITVSVSDGTVKTSIIFVLTVSTNEVPQGNDPPPVDPVPTGTMTKSLTQHGVTWTFDKEYRFGKFVNGDYWVVGPVKIVSKTPDWNGSVHGSMINPAFSSKVQGYDSRCGAYTSDLTVTFPRIVNPGESVVSAVSWLNTDSGAPVVAKVTCDGVQKLNLPRPLLKSAAVLTVLASVPANNGADLFRPAYAGKNKTLHSSANLKLDILPKLTPVAGSPSISAIVSGYKLPWIDHMGADKNQIVGGPSNNMPNYGREIAVKYGDGTLLLLLDKDHAQKKELAMYLTQIGIDYFGVLRTTVPGNIDNWGNTGGGLGSGRKWPILFAGVMLNDSQMKNAYRPEGLNYGPASSLEDGQTFYLTQAAINNAKAYNAAGPLVPDWRGRKIGEAVWGEFWYTRGIAPGAQGYQVCCTSNAWVGEALSARILGAQSLWNHPAFFDYMDWYLEWSKVFIGTKDVWQRSWSTFAANMWDSYRKNPVAQ